VDGDVILSFSRFGLTERELNVNLNPSSTADENAASSKYLMPYNANEGWNFLPSWDIAFLI